MKMEFRYCSHFKKALANGDLLKVEVSHKSNSKFFTTVEMALWSKDESVCRKFNKRIRFNLERLLPQKMRQGYVKWCINRQSRKVAGVNLVTEKVNASV